MRANAAPSIRLRTLVEVLPDGTGADEIEPTREEVSSYKAVTQVVRKQRGSGVWSSNILGTGPSKTFDVKDVGTVFQYRHLLELGLDREHRVFQITNRLLFRLLSKDSDPSLLFEYQKAAKDDPELAAWARDAMREGACAALAHGENNQDPRVRGCAIRLANRISQFLRSEFVEKPITKQGTRYFLEPEADPPSLNALTVLAFLPNYQRERAGLIERIGEYLNRPAPKKTVHIQAGKKAIKADQVFLGDPLHLDSAGRPKDLPFALHWMELLARLGLFESSPTAQRAFARLARDCDEYGAWTTKNLRGFPKSESGLADFAFPLEASDKKAEARRTDTTFRLALIARLIGLPLEVDEGVTAE